MKEDQESAPKEGKWFVSRIRKLSSRQTSKIACSSGYNLRCGTGFKTGARDSARKN